MTLSHRNAQGISKLRRAVIEETGFFLEKDMQFKPWKRERLERQRLVAPDRSFSPSDTSAPDFALPAIVPRQRTPAVTKLAKVLLRRNNKLVKSRLHVSLTEDGPPAEKKSGFYFRHLLQAEKKKVPTHPAESKGKHKAERPLCLPFTSFREQSPAAEITSEERDYSFLLCKTRRLLSQLRERGKPLDPIQTLPHEVRFHKKMGSLGANPGRLRLSSFLEKVKTAKAGKKDTNFDLSDQKQPRSPLSATKRPKMQLAHKSTRTCSTFSPKSTTSPEELKQFFGFRQATHPVAKLFAEALVVNQKTSTPRIKLHLKERREPSPSNFPSLQSIVSPGLENLNSRIKSYIKAQSNTFSFPHAHCVGC